MRRNLVAIIVAFAFTISLAVTALADSSTSSYPIYDSCNQQVINMTVTTHLEANTSPQGQTQFAIKAHGTGTDGSGTDYVLNNPLHIHEDLSPDHSSFEETATYHLISKGPSANLITTFVYHADLTTGQILVDHFSSSCNG